MNSAPVDILALAEQQEPTALEKSWGEVLTVPSNGVEDYFGSSSAPGICITQPVKVQGLAYSLLPNYM